MFHRFSRLSGVSRAVQTRYVVCNNKKIAVLLNHPRFYCKSSGSHGPNDDKKVNNSDACGGVRKKRPLNVCKPAYPRPCIPTPPPNRLGPLQCPPGLNRMDKMPKPACPYDEEHDKQNKKYLRHLLLGLLVTAATLAALWYNLEFTKKDVNPKPKKEKKFTRPKPTCRIPPSANALPKHVPYLLIGGGTASFSAFRAIKSSDPTAKVLVISNECYYPYMRTPLSKEMWFTNEQNVNKLIFKQWNGTERSLFYEHEEFYTTPQSLNSSENGGVAIAQGYSVTKIDPVERIAYLDDGTEISYDKCLIATGARPKNLDVFKSASPQIQDKVTLYRDIFDFQELDEICKDAKSVAIIGSGFLGSELACALGKTGQKRGMKVYQIFREAGNMGRVLPEYLSHWTTERVRKEGVNIINNTEVEDVTLKNKNELILHLNNGSKVTANHVIVAVGVEPNTELAKASRLEVDPELGGFLVNAEMEARSNLYVAGDCCCFYDVILGRRRVEHHDHAVVSGRLAGENMTGAAKPYLHQSMFWSDLGPEVGYEAIGRVDSSLPTVGVFAKATEADSPKAVVTATDNNLRSATEEKSKEPEPKKEKSQKNETNVTNDDYGKGVIFYLKDDIVVGIVLWNVFNRMSVARQVLKDERKYDDLNEVAKLFNIHEE